MYDFQALMYAVTALEAAYEEHVEARIEAEHLRTSNAGGSPIVTDTFTLRAYCWCEGDIPGHENGCPPNFSCPAFDIDLDWYKHTGRGMSASREMSAAEVIDMTEVCRQSILRLPEGRRVLITGSREWAADLTDRWNIAPDWTTLPSRQREVMVDAFRQARTRANGAHMTIVYGGARGADTLAALLAERSPHAHAELWPAEWQMEDPRDPYDRTRALANMFVRRGAEGFTYVNAAGHRRNAAMGDSGVAECLAFFADGAGNRGTQGMVNYARKKSIPVYEYRA